MSIKKLLSIALSSVMAITMVSAQALAETYTAQESSISVKGEVLEYGYYTCKNGELTVSDENNFNLAIFDDEYDVILLNSYNGGEISSNGSFIIGYNGENTVTSSSTSVPAISNNSEAGVISFINVDEGMDNTIADRLNIFGANATKGDAGDAVVSAGVVFLNGVINVVGGTSQDSNASQGNGIIGYLMVEGGEHYISSGIGEDTGNTFGVAGGFDVLNADIDVVGNNDAIIAYSININNSSVTANSKNIGNAITSFGGIVINNSSVLATTTYGSGIQSHGNIDVSSSTVEATGKGDYNSGISAIYQDVSETHDITINDSIVKATGSSTYGYGLVAQNINVANSEVYAFGGTQLDSEYNAAGFGILNLMVLDIQNSYLQATGYVAVNNAPVAKNAVWSKNIDGSSPSEFKEEDLYSYKYLLIEKNNVGDINGNSIIDNTDVLQLFQYVSGSSVNIVESNADVNADGVISNLDVFALLALITN